MTEWTVVGGGDKGGILVREGVELKSPAAKDRLSTGAVVEELEMKGDRLHYKLISGEGPKTGWVATSLSGKALMEKKEEDTPGDWGGPGASAGPVEVDEELKKKIVALAETKKKEGALANYCMKYKVHKYPLDGCKLRVFCFHCAGSAESIYTAPNTAFINWCNKETKAVEAIALDYPGRDKLLKAEKISNTQKMAEDLLAVCYDLLTDDVPYVVWGHSVGTWVGFEFLTLARKIGIKMPKAAYFMGFPAPHLPWAERPWPRSKGKPDKEVQETLTKWDEGHFSGAGKVVFDEPAWTDTWNKMMRSDFQLYDEYRFLEKDSPKFEFPIHAWHFENEHYNKEPMIEMWKDWTTGDFDHCLMKDMGHLVCFYKPDLKKIYFEKIVESMKKYI
jgi:surfactin synthase thioesterase subunit